MIITDKFRFTQINENDFKFIKDYLADIETTKYLPLERPYNEKETYEWFEGRLEHWKENEFGTFILREKSNKIPIGYCGIEFAKNSHFVDIRYGIERKKWGQGYAFSAAKSVLEYGFNEVNLSVIYGAAVPGNTASIRILEKLGMNPDKDFNIYGKNVCPYSIKKSLFNKKFADL